MALFHTILVPTDFSENADAALETAVALADALGAAVRVAHVATKSSVREAVKAGLLAPGDDDATVERKVRELREMRMATHLAALGERAATVEQVYLAGDPSCEIVDYASANGVDLIVMGRRGTTLADVMLGSVAERVVRHANCPVLIVKRPTP
jgi:nucleotide-binding universal stress UspA family protein